MGITRKLPTIKEQITDSDDKMISKILHNNPKLTYAEAAEIYFKQSKFGNLKKYLI